MDKNSINFHLYLGKKDYEILQWKNSLPPKCFKYFVEQILLSHINGYKIMLPRTHEQVEIEPKYTPIHMIITNEQIISFLEQQSSGERSKNVKEILLFYIREAQDMALVSSNKKKRKTIVAPPQQPKIVSRSLPTVAETIKHTTKPAQEKHDVKEEKGTVAQSVPEAKSEVAPAVSRTPTKNNPMMQALFKMSGDE